MKPVCYVSETARIGGGEVSLLTLIRHLDRRRYRPIAVCYGGGELVNRLSKLGVETHIFKRGGILSNFTIVLNLLRLVRSRRIRLVHINTLDIRAGIAARISGAPLLGHLRVIFPFTFIDRLFVRLATRVISVSDAVRDHFCEGRRGLMAKFVTIPNSVSLNGVPRKADIRSELGHPHQTRLVGAVARIDPWKGHHTFVQAAAELKHPGVRFLLVGNADAGDPESLTYEKKLHRMVERLVLTDDFTFLGFRQDALAIIKQLDVLVVSSLILKTDTGLKTEGFGRVVIEAMALGTPVVATRVGGIPEIIIHGESGLLVAPETPAEMAAAVASLLSDGELYRKISEGGKQRFQERFNIETHIARIHSLYDNLLLT